MRDDQIWVVGSPNQHWRNQFGLMLAEQAAFVAFMLRCVLIVLILLSFHFLSDSNAQDTQVREVYSSSPESTYVNSANVSEYKARLPKEFVALVSAGIISFNTAAKLNFEWATNPLPENISGAEILHQAKLALASRRFAEFDFSVTEGDTVPQKNFQGQFERAYSDVGTEVSFREKVKLAYPGVRDAYALLTIRGLQSSEDSFWIYSPAINRTRQLTGSNRSDYMPGALLAADDLYVWSGSERSVSVVSSSLKLGLLPYYSLEQLPTSVTPAGCNIVDSTLRAGAWANTSIGKVRMVFVPREVVELELASLDPYSLYGRQLVYLERANGLPVYKTVYDRGGRLWKFVIGVYEAVADNGAHPALSAELVYDFLKKKLSILRVDKYSYCSGELAQGLLAKFDPARLGPAQEGN